MEAPRSRYAALARHLEALASETRLELLHDLTTPHAIHEIRVQPAQPRGDENPERALSRQAITRHITHLQGVGLIRRLREGPKERGDEYVVNHERLFALVDEIRTLARIRPRLDQPLEPGRTIDHRGARPRELPPPPRLVLAFGRDEGVGWSLAGAAGSRWRIGRGAACEIRLDYDPFLSVEHCALSRDPRGFVLTDAGSRNGTSVNWTRLPDSGSHVLAAGDLIIAGRCVLAFQP